MLAIVAAAAMTIAGGSFGPSWARSSVTEVRGLDLPFYEVVGSFLSVFEELEGGDLDSWLELHGIQPQSAAVPRLRALPTELTQAYRQRVRAGDPHPECERAREQGRALAEIHEVMVGEGSRLTWRGLLVSIDKNSRYSGSLYATDPPELLRQEQEAVSSCWAEGVHSVYPGAEVRP